MWSKVRSNERLVNQMQGATARSPMSAAGRRWHRCFFSPSVSLSLSPSLCVPACISRQWPDSFPDSLPQSPSVLTGPHKQGHSDCCKRKMYHLLGDGWHDVSAKSFYFDQKYYCSPPALFSPSLLIEQGGKRQLPLELQRKLPLQHDGKYTNHCWKMALFIQQPGLRWLRTDWGNWSESLMTYLANGAKGSKSLPITPHKVSIWHYYTSDFL